MQRRTALVLAFTSLSGLALAQPAPRPRQQPPRQPGAWHDEVVGRTFDDLPPGARERIQNEFRQGSPDLDTDSIRQRWNAMTPEQRRETLTVREFARRRQESGPGRGPGPGAGGRPTPGSAPGPRAGTGQGPGYGPGRRGPPAR